MEFEWRPNDCGEKILRPHHTVSAFILYFSQSVKNKPTITGPLNVFTYSSNHKLNMQSSCPSFGNTLCKMS